MSEIECDARLVSQINKSLYNGCIWMNMLVWCVHVCLIIIIQALKWWNLNAPKRFCLCAPDVLLTYIHTQERCYDVFVYLRQKFKYYVEGYSKYISGDVKVYYIYILINKYLNSFEVFCTWDWWQKRRQMYNRFPTKIMGPKNIQTSYMRTYISNNNQNV